MSITNHERPGVYSQYDASTVISSTGGGQNVGLAALYDGDEEVEGLYTFSRYEDAATAFGEATITELVRLLFLNGAAQVKAVPVADAESYEDAFALLEAEEDIAVVVCDSDTLTVQQALRDSVNTASANRRERIAVVRGKTAETVSNLVTQAQSLNSERMVLVAPLGGDAGAAVAAAVAGAIAAESDPAVPLGARSSRGWAPSRPSTATPRSTPWCGAASPLWRAWPEWSAWCGGSPPAPRPARPPTPPGGS